MSGNVKVSMFNTLFVSFRMLIQLYLIYYLFMIN